MDLFLKRCIEIKKKSILSASLSVKQGRVFLGCTSTKLDKCVLLKDHNAVTPVRLELVAPRSRVKHSTTEPLRSLRVHLIVQLGFKV